MQRQANGADGKTGEAVEHLNPTVWDRMMDDVDRGKVVTNEEIVRLYDEWAKDNHLDKGVEENGYQALDVMQRTLDELFPGSQGRDHVTILDVGACTGNSGQRMYEMGFRNIDALDPSEGSLQVAEKRGVYRKLLNLCMTAEPLDIPPDSYDAIVLLGVMGPSHISVDSFTEMIRLVKPGGYIINSTRADFLDRCPDYANQWKPAIESHVTAGRWRVLKDEHYDQHYGGRDGYLHVFQIC